MSSQRDRGIVRVLCIEDEPSHWQIRVQPILCKFATHLACRLEVMWSLYFPRSRSGKVEADLTQCNFLSISPEGNVATIHPKSEWMIDQIDIVVTDNVLGPAPIGWELAEMFLKSYPTFGRVVVYTQHCFTRDPKHGIILAVKPDAGGPTEDQSLAFVGAMRRCLNARRAMRRAVDRVAVRGVDVLKEHLDDLTDIIASISNQGGLYLEDRILYSKGFVDIWERWNDSGWAEMLGRASHGNLQCVFIAEGGYPGYMANAISRAVSRAQVVVLTEVESLKRKIRELASGVSYEMRATKNGCVSDTDIIQLAKYFLLKLDPELRICRRAEIVMQTMHDLRQAKRLRDFIARAVEIRKERDDYCPYVIGKDIAKASSEMGFNNRDQVFDIFQYDDDSVIEAAAKMIQSGVPANWKGNALLYQQALLHLCYSSADPWCRVTEKVRLRSPSKEDLTKVLFGKKWKVTKFEELRSTFANSGRDSWEFRWECIRSGSAHVEL